MITKRFILKTIDSFVLDSKYLWHDLEKLFS